ncbi:MAG: peptide ABC transporter substrate-binding protein [Candidatus Pacebacteria bacterium]|nr:peptide ABC transporter substrate-binding protein [Candidatus Paceibacterota bacterium]
MKNLLKSFFKKWFLLTLKERLFCFLFLIILLIGIVVFFSNLLTQITVLEPKEGGKLLFGAIGIPSYINPVLSQSNDCERDISELIYSSLFSIDGQGSLEPALAEKVEINEDGTSYTIFLKDNILWHDGVEFTADDVVFTIETIQNPKIKSPLRLSWEGVVVEKLGDNIIRFNLKNTYQPFLQNLTLKIIPKHVWEDIEPSFFNTAKYNLTPIGTGPYLFDNIEKTEKGKIVNYSLVANDKYFKNKPYISKIVFKFYDNYDSMKNGLLKKEIDGFFPLLIEDFDFFVNKKNIKINSLILARYYAVFLDFNNPLFKNEDIRQALDLAISREELTKEILQEQAIALGGPITPGFLGPEAEQEFNKIPEHSLETAKKLINSSGLAKEEPISFTLSLPHNTELIKVANYLVNSWEKIGLSVELQILPLATLEKEVIQPRSYEAFLFGEIVGQNPDLYSFWHSSQITDPGLNLSMFQNKELDKFLEIARQTFNEKKRLENLNNIQTLLAEEKPAIFLYNPFYLYLLPQSVKGNHIEYANLPSEKFTDIENWYLYSKRVLK